ncbi:MAG TPA: DEAD/DEAH box helicase [Gaiellaceae bacterium]|nr:DEAD/DEAH box helicase [Gaiellaceae bacterium]
MVNAVAELQQVELTGIEAAVGTGSFQRGRSYARAKRVLSLQWDPAERALTGSVVGQGGLYHATAFFSAGKDGALAFDDGECTCPVGFNCKHVVALVLVGAAGPDVGKPAQRNEPPHSPVTSIDEQAWERPFRALVGASASQAAGTPLALELSVKANGSSSGGALRLQARLLRPGARGGWVGGSLSWSRLDSWHVAGGGFREDHLALAEQLYALQRAEQGRSSYFYGYRVDKTIDLSDCGTQLWSVLDEAAQIGMIVVDERRGGGEPVQPRSGGVILDVSHRPGKDALLTPAIRADDGSTLAPLLFLGTAGHGAVCADPADRSDRGSRPLVLVHFQRPVSMQLQRLALDGKPLKIPANEFHRFTDELYPALRSVATVVSSDGSFALPTISAPSLTLRVSYRKQHALGLEWAWAYQIGPEARRVPLELDEAAPGLRDPAAERALLAGTDLGGTGLEGLELVDAAGQPVAGPARVLKGLDTMRFTIDVLPGLAERSDVSVEIDGRVPKYRDVGASLEIGLSTAEIAGERDWFDLGVTVSVDGRDVPFGELFVALARGDSHMLLGNGSHFSLLTPQLQSLRQLIDEARGLADSPSAPLRISSYQAGLWEELVGLGIVTRQALAWQRQVDSLLGLERLVEPDLPAGLTAELRPYQHEGFAWLASLWELELGGILADDMGLGKTLQTLALICHARDRDPGIGPFLVVAPTSVVSGWVSEAARFAPGLRVEPVTDTLARSGRTIEELAVGDVVVTTYTLLRLDAESYASVDWAGVILDEAQYVKNHQAKTYRSVRELPARFKLAITGTPMENNLLELWSLLSIVAPGLFPDPKRFTEDYARPIEREGDRERLARLRRRIKPLLKRRTKELVAADLPPKQEQTLDVALHPRHRKLYDVQLQRERQKVLGLIDDFDRNRFTILRSITLLRQLSLHPGLVESENDAVPCAKLDALVEQLEDVVGGGHRALVFSQFTGFLAKVRERLDAEGIGYCYLDGRTKRRDLLLERFKTGTDPVFLISLKAGGFGLNLTEADYCFLLDPWWNPATENQAIDRTHRIGQTRSVMVYRMIARDTIEEKVVALARRKAALFSGVMDDGDVFASTLTAEDIRGLLG